MLVSAVEHPAVGESAAWLERLGYLVEQIPVDGTGLVSPEVLAGMIREETVLVSVQYANPEVGTVQDIPALSAVTAERGVPFHTDAVQAAGSADLSVDALGVQAMTLAGHKVGAPHGIGVLYLRRRTPFEPLIHGGGQQRDRRSGTENVAAAVGMAVAMELAQGSQERDDSGSLTARRDRFIDAVELQVPGLGSPVTGPAACGAMPPSSWQAAAANQCCWTWSAAAFSALPAQRVTPEAPIPAPSSWRWA